MCLSKKLPVLALLLFAFAGSVFSQTVVGQDQNRRVVSTAVPFLNISPDARSAALGDVGVALSANANSSHWNPSQLAFAEKEMSFSVSYTPWLQNLVPDMSLSYLSGYKRINKRGVMGFSLRYFDLGEMKFTDQQGQVLQDFNPREVAFDATYAMQLSNNLSMGVTARYAYSNLTGNVSNSRVQLNASPGSTLAADISVSYRKEIEISNMTSLLAFGANISNLGQKITYNDPENADFIPTNLRLGSALTLELDSYNKITFALDMNKLLVPSPPVLDPQNNIVRGQDPKRPLLSGIFGSFSDAPDGMSEEFQEIAFAGGVEYWYNDLFALRGGYFYENANKGNRKYYTMGVGLKYNSFGIDFAYMVPQQQGHPLADTMRFSLMFDMDKKAKVSAAPPATE